MKQLGSRRQRGASTLVLLLPVSFLVLLAAALSTLAAANHRANTRSGNKLQAFYIADSGAQVGNAKVRSTGPTMADTTFTESLAGGTADVVVQQLAPGLYKVTSTGSYDGESATVEIHVQFDSGTGFDLESGVSFSVANGVEVEDNLRVIVDGSPVISGYDHDANGVLLADQSKARPAFGMNDVPDDKGMYLDIGATATPTIEGSPTATTEDAENQFSLLNDLRNHARDNADIFLAGSATLGDADTGSYGTAAAPVLVHYSSSGGGLTLTEGFTGYGTLVIDVREEDIHNTLTMQMNSSWYGLVVVRFGGEPEIDGDSAVTVGGNSKIVGGMGMAFSGEEIEIEGLGGIMKVTDTSEIRHSSQLLSNAPGMDVVADPSTNSDVVSYRLR